MMKRTLGVLLLLLALGVTSFAQNVELRFTWYSDGAEGDIMRDLLDRFEAENPGITVVLDVVPYQQILDNLPVQVQAGEGPDLARLTNFPGLRGYYLDLRPYLSDPDAFEAAFPAPVLAAFRAEGDETGLFGFPDLVSVTGPYINRTLFEQAGIPVPSDSGDPVSWEEWTEATRQVAEATGTPYAIAIDRTGHRIAGPAMSMCADLIDDDGNFTIDTPGFRQFAELLGSWHEEGITPREVWLGSGGTYAAAADFFDNGSLVMYMSGSWQIGRFSRNIGDAFDWEVVPNPTGDCGSTGIAGGAGIVGIGDTEHPEEVAKVMEFLSQPDVYGEYSARALFLPAHATVAASGVDFQTDNEDVKAALNTFVAEVPKLTQDALALNYHPFAFVYFTSARDRLTQWMVGELTLDEAIERIQQDIDAAAAGTS